MEKLNWVPVFYNGIETNVEVTKYGNVRRVKKDWVNYKTNAKLGEIDFSKLSKRKDNYIYIKVLIKNINRKSLSIHQLVASAFLEYKFYGHKMVVDHIDSNKLNNNLDNLRIVTQRENNKENTIKSGLPIGVTWLPKNKKYRARIKVNSKEVYLGCFNTIDEASQVYQNKLKTLLI